MRLLNRRKRERDAHLQAGYDARDVGDLDAAVAAFQLALALDPSDSFVYYNLGCAYSDFPETHAREAIAAWCQAIALRPDYVEPHFDLAQVYLTNGRFDDALPHLEAVLAQRPDWPAPHYGVAVVLAQRGDTNGAIEHLKAAVIQNPSWAKSAAADPLLASLDSSPEFRRIIQTDAVVRFEDLEAPADRDDSSDE